MYADDASSGVHGSSYVFISRFNYCVSSRPICLPRIIRKTKNSSFKNEKSKKEVDVAITVSNKDIV